MCALTVEKNNHSQNKIEAVNDYQTQVHDFVAVETDVVVLPLGAIVAYPTILNSSLPTNWSNENRQLSWYI